ncbi:AAA family ATPase [Legionella fallonii]|uniref:AAA+ ATPase domain-containing protein n=1 Tax=Legionella fallonii LLAP-10 TaxID=1212491 RepID=A0A098G1T1_9GAMM|nr:AAA family ATPase [Legionella fallonii]CEG55929.1 conserved protein of unknown function [P-loop containing nucleoside triphosphate hydrolases][F-BOX/LEUCINE RICH REPEAT PROTEIN] [Legionella fallonii LLAP-10]
MPNNPNYYKDQISNTIQYGTTPTNYFDVARLLRHLPAWKKSSETCIRKPKTLIINQTDIPEWDYNTSIIVAERLAALIEQGFDIYGVKNDRSLEKLNPRNLKPALKPRKKLKISDAELKTHAEKTLSLGYDELFVLNQKELEVLIEGDEEDYAPYYDENELNLNHSNLTIASLNKLLNLRKDSITLLDLLGCLNLKNGSITPQLKLPFLEVLRLGSSIAKPSSVFNGENVNRGVTLNSESIKCLIESTDQLRELSLCDDFDPLILNSIQTPERLEILELFYQPQLDQHSLKKLLQRALKLKYLDLSGCTLTPTFFQNLRLDSLEVLKLTLPTDVDIDAFVNFLKAASHLKTLGLFIDEKCTDLNFLKNLEFGLLEEFAVSGKISQDSLFVFLKKHAPRLKYLYLGGYQEFPEVLSKDLDFRALEQIDLSASNINTEILTRFVKGAFRLKKLSLNDCEHLSTPLPDGINLSSLTDLDLSFSTIDGAFLTKLLKQAPRITKLNVCDCNNLLPTLTEDLNTSSLEELNISHIEAANSDFLVKFLKNASQLKRLNLGFCEELDALPLELLCLNSLEELIVSGTPISTQALISILEKTPHLKKLDISGCPNIDLKELKPYLPPSLILCSPLSFSYNNLLQDSLRMDADTSFVPQTYHVKKLFYAANSEVDPETSLYRQQVFQKLTVNSKDCSVANAFELNVDPQSKQLRNLSLDKSAEDTWNLMPSQMDAKAHTYYSKQTIAAHEHWQPLASLSAQEEMLHYHLSDDKASIAIAYSQRDNLYYVKNTSGKQLSMDFLVRVPNDLSISDLPIDVNNKIQECLNFGAKALKRIPQPATGNDYLNALSEQKLGACRHRAIAFKAWMETYHPEIPVRIILNTSHAFAEVQWKGVWITCNLGGYPSRLNIDTSNAPSASKELKGSAAKVELTSSGETKVVNPPKCIYFPPRTQKALPKSGKQYIQNLCTSESKKLLIELNDEEALNALRYGIQSFSHITSRPCFYVNSPEDLICSSAYIQKIGDKGYPHPGPGGRLHDFLMKHGSQAPIILVNYAHFTPRDIVRFNALIDKERSADGTSLPEKAKIIGLTNPDGPNAYQGSDFYSRFNLVEECPLQPADFVQAPPPPAMATHSEGAAEVVEFFGGALWEEQVFGAWRLEGNALHFVEGSLVKALKSNKPIELRNAPWDNEDFLRFWQEMILYQEIRGPYGDILLPKEIQYTQSQGYSWAQLKNNLNLVSAEHVPEDTLVLNPTLLPEWFSRYACNNQDKTLTTIPGFLEQHQGATINAYLTAPLTEHAWARLLSFCQQYNKHLNLRCAPGVSLPNSLHTQPSNTILTSTPMKVDSLPSKDFAVYSSDIDWTLTQLNADVVLDISEAQSSSLLNNIQAEVNMKTLELKFEEQIGALIPALNQGKTVVLKGEFSAELQDRLMPFMLQRRQQASGQLILLSTKTQSSGLIPQLKHEVKDLEKEAWLEKKYPGCFSEEELKSYSFVHLQAIGQYRLLHPKAPYELAWLGMKTLTSSQKGVAYKDRLQAVELALQHNPFVFIAGKTGVGKTSFIRSFWKSKHQALHEGEQALKDWVFDTRPGLKVLFIDEANMAYTQWSMFEGLLHNPPTLLIDNKLIRLTSEHKVIFAGNPQAYGGDRQLPSFLERHGNSLLFEPLPQEVMYQELLAPLFPHKDNVQPLLDVMSFLEHCSTQEVLISPRELRTMALWTHAYCKAHPEASVQEVAHYYAYNFALPLVPNEHLDAFQKIYPQAPFIKHAHVKPQHLQLNTTNQPAWHALSDLIQLRRLRQTAPKTYFGGINGLMLEGEPGLGKSELVIQTLLAQGLTKGNPKQNNAGKSVFYTIPVSMPLTEKEALLRKAFDEGAVVVIDEINTGPSMERLLNTLLQEKTPEGNDANCPGFTLIATQNPSNRAGRTKQSNALKRRLHYVNIPPYTPEHMLEILLNKGLILETAQAMLEEYLTLQKTDPTKWCFRDLITRAEEELEALAKGRKSSSLSLAPFIAQKIEKLKEMAIDKKDTLLADFIKAKEDEAPTLETEEQRWKFNKTIEDTYAIAYSPQVKAIERLIEEYQSKTNWWGFFSLESAPSKAARIQAAFLKVPLEERHIVLSQKSPEAREFCKVLAEHRNIFSRLYYGDAVDLKTQRIRKEYAAEAFKCLAQTMEDLEHEQNHPPHSLLN